MDGATVLLVVIIIAVIAIGGWMVISRRTPQNTLNNQRPEISKTKPPSANPTSTAVGGPIKPPSDRQSAEQDSKTEQPAPLLEPEPAKELPSETTPSTGRKRLPGGEPVYADIDEDEPILENFVKDISAPPKPLSDKDQEKSGSKVVPPITTPSGEIKSTDTIELADDFVNIGGVKVPRRKAEDGSEDNRQNEPDKYADLPTLISPSVDKKQAEEVTKCCIS